MPLTRRLLTACALCLLGCATGAKQSNLMGQIAKTSTMSPEQLRIVVRSFAPRFSGQFEELADELIRRRPTPEMRKSMTQFKINGLPAIQSALFQADPAGALIDTWALLAQMEGVVDHGFSLDDASRDYARRRLEAMEDELQRLWTKAIGKADVSGDRATVHRWAAEHPVTVSLASRVPTTELLAGLTAVEGVKPLEAPATILGVTQDLTARLDTQTSFLPKQARWQAEYFMLEALGDPTMHPPIPELSALLGQTGQLTGAVSQLPGYIDRQRDAVLTSIRSERLGVQDFVDRQRIETQSFIRQERQAAIADAGRIARDSVDHAFDRASALLDRILIWASVVLLLGGLFALIALVLITRRLAPRRARAAAGDGAYHPFNERPEEHAPH
jgi:hypothetical protein